MHPSAHRDDLPGTANNIITGVKEESGREGQVLYFYEKNLRFLALDIPSSFLSTWN